VPEIEIGLYLAYLVPNVGKYLKIYSIRWLGSLNVIRNGIFRQIIHDFLLSSIVTKSLLYRFWDSEVVEKIFCPSSTCVWGNPLKFHQVLSCKTTKNRRANCSERKGVEVCQKTVQFDTRFLNMQFSRLGATL